MRHVQRLGSVLLALVYLALPGGLAGVRACAHHDAAALQEPSAQDHHGGHGAAEPDDAPHGGCTCLDTCAAGDTVVLHPATVTAPAATPTAPAPRPSVAATSPVPTRPPHFLPFANAPPAIPA